MKTAIPVLAAALLLSAALPASAQEKPVTTTQAVRILLSGRLELDYVFRDAALAEFVATDVVAPPVQADAGTFEGYLAVAIDVELSDKVTIAVEVGTRRGDGGLIDTWSNGLAAPGLLLREARGVIGDFLTEGLSLEVGIVNWGFDVDGRGGSLFAPRRSQSFARNLADAALGLAAGTRFNAPDLLDPIGALLTWQRETLRVDLAILPAVIEAGPAAGDEAIYAADAFLKFDEAGSRLGLLVLLVDTGGAGAITGTGGPVVTFGGGLILHGLVKGLSVSGEGYFQFGQAGTFGGAAVEADGFAFQAAVDYAFEGGAMVGVSFLYLSGDGTAGDNRAGNFMSFEDVSDLLIVEDMRTGLDWDTNYYAARVRGQLPLSVLNAKDNLVLSIVYGFCRSAQALGAASALGHEIDVRARFDVTRQVAIHAAAGVLLGSDLLSQAGTAPGNDDFTFALLIGADFRY